jgi:hypothetical protein
MTSPRGTPDWRRDVAVPAGILIDLHYRTNVRVNVEHERVGRPTTRRAFDRSRAASGVLDDSQRSAATGEERFHRFGCEPSAVVV